MRKERLRRTCKQERGRFRFILSLVTYGTWPDDSDEVTIADMIVEQYRKFFDQVLST